MNCDDCPPSALFIAGRRRLRDAVGAVVSVVGVGVTAAVLVILLRRWSQATAPQRRAMAPVLWSGVVMLVLLVGLLGLGRRGRERA